MAVILSAPYNYFTDSNGLPLSGGLVYTYSAGTLTPLATYTDATGSTPAANPIVLDSAGRAAIWVSGYYKFIVKDSLNNTIKTVDGITALNAGGDMAKAVYDPALVAQQLVGTSATQTLTNKTISGTSNTLTVRLANDVSGTLPIANGGTNDTGTAWTAYTPTIAAGSGTFTTVSATGRYKTIGKTVFVNIKVSVTTVGSAALYITATLPVQAAAEQYIISGKETATSGASLNGEIDSGATVVAIRKYDATFPAVNASVCTITGVYESV